MEKEEVPQLITEQRFTALRFPVQGEAFHRCSLTWALMTGLTCSVVFFACLSIVDAQISVSITSINGGGGVGRVPNAPYDWVDINGNGQEGYVIVESNGCHHIQTYTTTSHTAQRYDWCGGNGWGNVVKGKWIDLNGDGRHQFINLANNDPSCSGFLSHRFTFYTTGFAKDFNQKSCTNVPSSGATVDWIDVNGDGRLELVAAKSNSCHFVTFFNADGTVASTQQDCTGLPSGGVKDWIDITGDARPEFVKVEGSCHSFTFYNADGTVATNYQDPICNGHDLGGGQHIGESYKWIDVNGDGISEFVTRNHPSGIHDVTFYNTDGSVAQNVSSPGHGQGSNLTRWLDMNGDGIDDYITISLNNVGVHHFTFYNPDGTVSNNLSPGGGHHIEAGASVGFADLNGDGKRQYITVGDQNTGHRHAVSSYTFTGIPDGPPDTTSPEVMPPTPIAILAVDSTGTPASDPTIQTFLSSATATDNVDGDVTASITNDAPTQFPVGLTTVVFSATDSAGNFGTNQSTVTVYEMLTIAPTTHTASAGTGTISFAANGGIAPYTFSISTNQSGGNIEVATGVYTAGPASGSDLVQVADTIGNVATATVIVLDDSMIFIPLMHNGQFIPIFIP